MIFLLKDMILILLSEGPWLFKMKLTLITAISENKVIGFKNKVPWHIPEDMKRFRELTIDHPVIMGRKTYDSLPDKFRPLPDRKNIVLSTSLEPQEKIYIARNMEEALKLTKGRDSSVIGGERVYQLFLPLIDQLEITRVYRDFEGDAFFPEINWDEWELSKREEGVSKKQIHYSFLTYLRK